MTSATATPPVTPGRVFRIPPLPRSAWLVLAADGVSAIGSGLTLPFLMVYLNQVRGLEVHWAGMAVSAVAFAGLAGNPAGGRLADRWGARNALAGGLLVAGLGSFALAEVASVAGAFLACAILGMGAAIILPSLDALLGGLVEPSQRSTVFAVRHAVMNAGLALGAATAGLLADISDPASFYRLYLLDGLTFLLFIPVLLARRDLRRERAEHDGGQGFAQVVADRSFRWIWLWVVIVVIAGAAQFHAAFPAFAAREGGLSASELGLVYAANCLAVIVVQLPILRLMRGRRRTRGMVMVSLCWAVAWALTLASPGAWALVTLTLAMVVFAVGEAFLSPTVAPMINDLAPEHLRGRYNGLHALAYTSGYIVGPALCGLALAASTGHAFLLACVAVLGVAVLVAGRLERLLPASLNREQT